jgi:hypothetical protein
VRRMFGQCSHDMLTCGLCDAPIPRMISAIGLRQARAQRFV